MVQFASRSSDVWGNSKTSQLARSFVGTIQIYPARKRTSLKLNGLIAYPSLVVRPSLTKRARSSQDEHRYTLLGLWPVGFAELVVRGGNYEANKTFLFELTMSDVMSLEDFIPQNVSKRCAKRAHHDAEKIKVVSFKSTYMSCQECV